jgi:RNA polymerase sigma-70 factor (ECF subfamily)
VDHDRSGQPGDSAWLESDAALIADGSGEAFGRLYDRHVSFLLGWSYRRTGDAETAADLTMEVFAAAYAARRRYDPSYASARPWLLGIAKRQLSRVLHGRRLSTKYRDKLGIATSAALQPDDTERIERLADFANLRGSLQDAMAALPARQAQAVWLRVGLDLPYPVVAEKLGCSVGAARVRVTRALARLNEALEAG